MKALVFLGEYICMPGLHQPLISFTFKCSLCYPFNMFFSQLVQDSTFKCFTFSLPWMKGFICT